MANRSQLGGSFSGLMGKNKDICKGAAHYIFEDLRIEVDITEYLLLATLMKGTHIRKTFHQSTTLPNIRRDL